MRIALFTLISLLASAASAQTVGGSATMEHDPMEQTSEHFDLVALADGVWAAVHREGGMAISNAGIVDLGDRTLVFDAFMTAEAAAELRDVAGSITGREVTILVNSHPHNDHVRGNQVFAHSETIVSSAATRAGMAEEEPAAVAAEREWVPVRLAETMRQLESAPPDQREALRLWRDYYKAVLRSHEGLRITLPTLSFEGTLTLHGSARRAELRAMGPGHTRNDVVLYLPDDRILFAGDLLFVNHHPWLGDAAPSEWSASLRAMHEWDVDAVVPGHGSVSAPDSFLTLARYIDTLGRLVSDHAAAGAEVDDVASLPMPEAYEDWRLTAFFPMNLRALYEAHTADIR